MQRRPRREVISRRLLSSEAILSLLVARLVLALFSFRGITGLVSRPSRKPQLSGRERRRARLIVNRAIFGASRLLPLKNTCFHRAIAAYFMLRRRGVSTTLYYGAAILPGRGLTGHVWLQDSREFIVGRDAAKRYRVLAYFPSSNNACQCRQRMSA